jgi:hypothetical protein
MQADIKNISMVVWNEFINDAQVLTEAYTNFFNKSLN